MSDIYGTTQDVTISIVEHGEESAYGLAQPIGLFALVIGSSNGTVVIEGTRGELNDFAAHLASTVRVGLKSR